MTRTDEPALEVFHQRAESLLELLENPPPVARCGVHTVPFRFFDGAVAMGMCHGSFLSGVTPSDLSRDPNLSAVTLNDGNLTVTRVRRVKPEDVRGRVSQKYCCYPNLLELSVSVTEGRMAKVYGYREILTFVNTGDTEFSNGAGSFSFRGRYIHAGSKSFGGGGLGAPVSWEGTSTGPGSVCKDPSLLFSLMMSMGLEFSLDYHWRVRLRLSDGSFSCQILTDAGGVRDLFKLRDVEPGKKRRASLRHWVARHKRELTGEDYTWVRKHLRGKTAFSWDGISGEITPAPAEIEEASRCHV